MNKNGISLVALVITIIVLIILTGAVILTGVNAPDNAASAVGNWNKAQVQDAVTIYVMNYIAENSTAGTVANAKTALTALVNSWTDATPAISTGWKNTAGDTLGISQTELAKYNVSEKGIIQ